MLRLHTPSDSKNCAIVLCTDRNYFPPAYGLALKLARQLPEFPDIHILTEAGPHLDRVPTDVPFSISTPDFVERLPRMPDKVLRPLSPFAFLRLLLPDVVPGYSRILYLDCDIRVDGSLAPLMRLDMHGATIAAVDDTGEYRDAHSKDDQVGRQRLGLDPNTPSFNSGVLLIDCDRWRSEGRSESALACIRRHGANLRHYDQDVFNIMFEKAWLPLSPRWNFPCQAFESTVEAILRPVLFHNFAKPWTFGAAIRREVLHFRESLYRTPFEDFARRTPTYREIKRAVENRSKALLQTATFFLPASRRRLEARHPMRCPRMIASRVIESVGMRRYADVEQKISAIDCAALQSLLQAPAVTR